MDDESVGELSLSSIFESILGLQAHWQRENSNEMRMRGELVRDSSVKALRALVGEKRRFEIEGSDGTGLKARVPWVRIFSPRRSPAPTQGWYLVYLFAADGSAVYLSLNQGTTIPEAGFKGRPRELLEKKAAWARSALDRMIPASSRSRPSMVLADPGALGPGYEAGDVASLGYSHGRIPADDVLERDLDQFLDALDALYQAEAAAARQRRGFETGGVLTGFSDPVPLVPVNIRDVPEGAGVHVVWDPEGQPLYVGQTSRQRDRIRDHLSDRGASILFEKVARLLEEQLPRTARDSEVRSYLNGCDFSWVETSTPSELKARIMDELTPRFNDVRPKLTEAASKYALVLYVGQAAAENLRVGLERRTWGWKEWRDEYAQASPGDWLVIGTGYDGGSVRTQDEEWRRHRLARVVLGRLTTAVYEDSTPLWPDEGPGGNSYPYRIQFEVVREARDAHLGPDGPMGSEVVDALRRSACIRGLGHRVPASGALFDFAADLTDVAETPDLSAPVVGLDGVCREFAADLLDANLDFGAEHVGFVRAFVTSLATKRLVLLTGLSGSGKTRLGLGFGQWLGADGLLVVAVRPDWTGPDALLGFEDALRSDVRSRVWHAPPTLEFMLKAARNPQRPHLLLLDEMNLAHVERYFADLLSGMESDEPVLPNVVFRDGQWFLDSVEPLIPVPRNLFVVGTVNVDETTYMFSPKVLDRANTIEFRVDADDLRVDTLRPRRVDQAKEVFARSFLAVATDDDFQNEFPSSLRDEIATELRKLHSALSPFGFEFGHRLFYEALRFAALFEAAGEVTRLSALDIQVKQKVLPRMHGSVRRLRDPLQVVAQFCYDLSVPSVAEKSSFDVDAVSSAPALPNAFDKVRRMTWSLRANQFASFAE